MELFPYQSVEVCIPRSNTMMNHFDGYGKPANGILGHPNQSGDEWSVMFLNKRGQVYDEVAWYPERYIKVLDDSSKTILRNIKRCKKDNWGSNKHSR